MMSNSSEALGISSCCFGLARVVFGSRKVDLQPGWLSGPSLSKRTLDVGNLQG